MSPNNKSKSASLINKSTRVNIYKTVSIYTESFIVPLMFQGPSLDNRLLQQQTQASQAVLSIIRNHIKWLQVLTALKDHRIFIMLLLKGACAKFPLR